MARQSQISAALPAREFQPASAASHLSGRRAARHAASVIGAWGRVAQGPASVVLACASGSRVKAPSSGRVPACHGSWRSSCGRVPAWNTPQRPSCGQGGAGTGFHVRRWGLCLTAPRLRVRRFVACQTPPWPVGAYSPAADSLSRPARRLFPLLSHVRPCP